MVKHTQAILRQFPTNCLSVFDHFVKLVLKGLNTLPGDFIETNKKFYSQFEMEELYEEM